MFSIGKRLLKKSFLFFSKTEKKFLNWCLEQVLHFSKLAFKLSGLLKWFHIKYSTYNSTLVLDKELYLKVVRFCLKILSFQWWWNSVTIFLYRWNENKYSGDGGGYSVKENESDLRDCLFIRVPQVKNLKKMWTSTLNLNCHAVQESILLISNNEIALKIIYVCLESWVISVCKRREYCIYFLSMKYIMEDQTRFHEWHIDNDNDTIMIYSVCLAQPLFYCFLSYYIGNI